MAEPTPSQTVGPFFSIGLCTRPQHELVPEAAEGAIAIAGRVLDGDGEAVPDAVVEAWDRAGDGGDAAAPTRRAPIGWSRRGRTPAPASEAPHLALLVFARGLLKPVLTRMYLPDEEQANAADPVLAALDPDERATLVARLDGADLVFDIHLQGEGQTTFFVL